MVQQGRGVNLDKDGQFSMDGLKLTKMIRRVVAVCEWEHSRLVAVSSKVVVVLMMMATDIFNLRS
jgi:hypothetical protein